jgi:hypothetical protein
VFQPTHRFLTTETAAKNNVDEVVALCHQLTQLSNKNRKKVRELQSANRLSAKHSILVNQLSQSVA